MSRNQANCLLLLAAALWGFGNVAQKTVLLHLDPFTAVAMRCLIGGVLVLPLTRMESSQLNTSGFWISGFRVALLFTVATLIQQASYLNASVTNASFLVNTAAVMTPILSWFFFKERLCRQVLVAGALTLSGALLMGGGLTSIAGGDLLAIISAACYALWMIELGRHLRVHGMPVRTACTQFLCAAFVAFVVSSFSGGIDLGQIAAAWRELLVLGIGSTALAFGLQTLAQRHTPATHAAVIVSAEGIFGAVGAAIFLGEQITILALAGSALITISILHLAFVRTTTSSDLFSGKAKLSH